VLLLLLLEVELIIILEVLAIKDKSFLSKYIYINISILEKASIKKIDEQNLPWVIYVSGSVGKWYLSKSSFFQPLSLKNFRTWKL